MFCFQIIIYLSLFFILKSLIFIGNFCIVFTLDNRCWRNHKKILKIHLYSIQFFMTRIRTDPNERSVSWTSLRPVRRSIAFPQGRVRRLTRRFPIERDIASIDSALSRRMQTLISAVPEKLTQFWLPIFWVANLLDYFYCSLSM